MALRKCPNPPPKSGFACAAHLRPSVTTTLQACRRCGYGVGVEIGHHTLREGLAVGPQYLRVAVSRGLRARSELQRGAVPNSFIGAEVREVNIPAEGREGQTALD